MNQFAKLDRKFIWHPFTQMRDWLKREPIVIACPVGAQFCAMSKAVNIWMPTPPSGQTCMAIAIPKSILPSNGS